MDTLVGIYRHRDPLRMYVDHTRIPDLLQITPATDVGSREARKYIDDYVLQTHDKPRSSNAKAFYTSIAGMTLTPLQVSMLFMGCYGYVYDECHNGNLTYKMLHDKEIWSAHTTHNRFSPAGSRRLQSRCNSGRQVGVQLHERFCQSHTCEAKQRQRGGSPKQRPYCIAEASDGQGTCINSVLQWGAESSLAGQWLPAAGGDGAWSARTGSWPMRMCGDIFFAVEGQFADDRTSVFQPSCCRGCEGRGVGVAVAGRAEAWACSGRVTAICPSSLALVTAQYSKCSVLDRVY
jgi:hypothetical protein